MTSFAHLAAASVGPDVIFCPNYPGPAHFSWTVPDLALDKEVVVVSPGGKALFSWKKDSLPLDEYVFWDRFDNVDFEGANIRFSLSEVRSSDGGLYSCRENSVRGPVIPDCGQTLHYIEISQPSISLGEQPVLGQQGRLVCSGQVPVEWKDRGLEFYYEWFKDGQEMPRQRDSVLVLSPLQPSDQGKYSCRVSESSRSCATSAESIPLSLTVADQVTLSLTSDVEVREGEDFTLTCSVDSSPTALLQWLVDGVLRRYVTANLDRYVVVKATTRDSGNYTCRAAIGQNLELSQSTSVTVTAHNDGKAEEETPRVKVGETKETGQGASLLASRLLLLLVTSAAILLC